MWAGKVRMKTRKHLTFIVGSLGAAWPAVAGIEVIRDIIYESPGSRDSRLDLYLPAGTPEPFTPTVVFVHGGGFTSGDKSVDAEYCRALAGAGYPVVSCNYTLAALGAPSFPQAVRDVKNVVRWVKTEGADRHGLSPTLVITGASAGGTFAMMAAMTTGEPLFETLPPPPGGYRAHALVTLWGESDGIWDVKFRGQSPVLFRYLGDWLNERTRPIYYSAFPINYVDACDTPAALFHATGDTTVPYQHSTRMAEAMGQVGLFTDVTVIAGGAHGFATFGGREVMAATVATLIPRLLEQSNSPDLSGDGRLDILDFLEFQNLFAAGDPLADFDRSTGRGVLDVFDFLEFQNRFENGCG